MSRSLRNTSGGKAVSSSLAPRTYRTNSTLAVDSWRRGGGKNSPVSIEILLVGGGGGNGAGNGAEAFSYAYGGSGGGGGGVYSSVAGNVSGGPGGVVQPVTLITPGVVHTITIGAMNNQSTFAAPSISTIYAYAGGGGSGGGPGGTAGSYTGANGQYSGGPPTYAQYTAAGGGGGGAGGPGNAGGGAGADGGGGGAIYNGIYNWPTLSANYQNYGQGGGAGATGNYFGAGPGPGPYGVYGAGGGSQGVCIFRYPSEFDLAETTTGSPTIATYNGFHVYVFLNSGTITF